MRSQPWTEPAIAHRTQERLAVTACHDRAITALIVGPASVPSRLFAALRPRFAGLTALTGSSVVPGMGTYVMARRCPTTRGSLAYSAEPWAANAVPKRRSTQDLFLRLAVDGVGHGVLQFISSSVMRRPEPSGRPHLLSVEEAAEYLGISRGTMRNWISMRRIEHVKVGRLTRVAQGALDRYIAANTIPAAGE
jgi:excisionase family DNA binding protein